MVIVEIYFKYIYIYCWTAIFNIVQRLVSNETISWGIGIYHLFKILIILESKKAEKRRAKVQWSLEKKALSINPIIE